MELIIISKWRIKKDGAQDKNRFIFTLANEHFLQNITVSAEQFTTMRKQLEKNGKITKKEVKEIGKYQTIYNFYIG